MTEQHGTGLLLIAMGIILKLLPENKPLPKRSAAALKPPSDEGRKSQLEIEQEEEKRPLV